MKFKPVSRKLTESGKRHRKPEYKRKGDGGPMKLTAKQTGRLKKRLLAQKNELAAWLERENHGLDRQMDSSNLELSLYDNHPGDAGTELFERSKDLALVDHAEHRLEQMELALLRIESGEYGYCTVCDAPIPYQRLEAIPWTPYCIRHAEENPSSKRPVEEQVLQPPFGRTSLDEKPDETSFDGEDAWQIVAAYGNANSPAAAENPDEFRYEDPYLESDEGDGFVTPIESFLATDLYGEARVVVRNGQYYDYLHKGEGDRTLESPGETDPDSTG